MRVRLLKSKVLVLLIFVGIFTFLFMRKISTSMMFAGPEPGSSLLVILVISAAGHIAHRKAIRETWAGRTRGYTFDDVRTVFAVAVDDLSIEQRRVLLIEGSAYNDMLLLSGASDDYRSLARKVKVAMQWLHGSTAFSFLLKVDDDSFVMIPELIDYLKALGRWERLYLGFFRGSASVHWKGKWAETNWFLCSHYLPHARGGGYLLSHDLVKYIASNARLLMDYANEDVSVGTWLAPLNILRLHEPRFDVEYRSRGCNNSYLVTHKISPDEMRQRLSNLESTGKLCRPERALYPSYQYNWSVNPLKCCVRSWLVP